MSGATGLEEVVNALKALYQGTSQAEREQANVWLGQFQRTPGAWTTADAILGDDNLGVEAKLFAAQTLRNKIISDLAELGEKGALELRDSLVRHLLRARAGMRPLVTQLCLGLADVAVQVGAWADPFSDMAAAFREDAAAVGCLLEFLTVLPEEAVNERLEVPADFFRQRTELLLTRRAGDVIALLVQCLQQTDAHTRVLMCFTSWLRSGEITLAMIQDTPLVELVFAALQAEDSTVFETAVDAVCGIIQETHIDRDDSPEAVQAKDAAVERVLLPQLGALATQMRSDAQLAAGDEERARGYCHVFTEAGEAWVERIVGSIATFEGLVGALVDCMRLTTLDVITMMFDFWARLADVTLDCTSSCDGARRTLVVVYSTLIDIIIGHVRYPVADTAMSAKERDEFREFRHSIGDVLKDCVRVVGQSRALTQAYDVMARGIDGTSQTPWQDIEAPLFALRAMGAEVAPEEAEVLPKIMDMFARFPQHPRLRYAATLVIGRYTEWTYEHPQYVPFQLSYIVEGFKDREVAAASAQALKYLCQDCSRFLAAHWAELLRFFAETASSGTLEDADVIEFAEALAHVVSAVQAPETPAALEAFCLPVARELDALLQRAEASERDGAQVALLLDRLGVFLRFVHVDGNAPAEDLVSRIVVQTWPLVAAVLHRFAADAQVAESACKFLRVAAEFYGAVLRPEIGQVVDAVVNAFRATGLGVYLWLARRIIGVSSTLASDNAAALQLIATIVERMSEAALSLFAASSFSDAPETTEDYFRLVERAVEMAPGYVLNTSMFPLVFQAAAAALDVNHFHAQLAVLRAWAQVLGPTRRHLRLIRDSSSDSHYDAYPVNRVVDMCAAHGLDVAARLLLGMMHRFDRENVTDAAEVFVSLTVIASDGPCIIAAQFENPPLPTMCEWAQTALAQVPEANLSNSEKQVFLQDLADCIQRRQWSKIKTLVSDFSASFWRRNSAKN
ncbi:Nuclear import receptor [Coemansia sp. RSA 485]|nr:Nuclear import receptor [Coemansia sp. RSA 485]